MFKSDSLLTKYLEHSASLGGTSPLNKVNQAGLMYDLGEARDAVPGWPADSKYPPDIADKIVSDPGGFLGTAVEASFKPFVAGQVGRPFTWAGEKMAKKAGRNLTKKAGAKLLTKLGSRMIPGLGWGLAAADIIDYFGVPIYDYIPGGDYMTWRDTSEGEE